MTGVVDALHERCAAPLDAFAAHPFFLAVEADALTQSQKICYFRIERAFVWRAVGIFANVLAKSPDLAAARHLVAILDGLVHDQIDLFDDIFARLGASPLAPGALPPAAQKMADAITSMTAEADYVEGLAAMYAAELTYATVSARMMRSPPADDLLRDWFALHARPPFTDGVAWIAGELERHGHEGNTLDRLEVCVRKVVALEMDFHDEPLAR